LSAFRGGILVLDDDDDLTLVLGTMITRETGNACLSLRSFAELRRRRVDALQCAIAVLDVDLGVGQPSGLDAFAWLRAERFAGRIAFLTGHLPTHPLVERAAQLADADVFCKPLDLDRLMAMLQC
jgi:DNA-binding NtrC family response regulator